MWKLPWPYAGLKLIRINVMYLLLLTIFTEKDSDAYRESSKNEIRQNEKAISKMRQKNRAKRIQLAQDENVSYINILSVCLCRGGPIDRVHVTRMLPVEAKSNLYAVHACSIAKAEYCKFVWAD